MNGGTEASKGKIIATNALITSTVDSSVCSRFVCAPLLVNLLPLGALNATKLSSMILLQMAPGAKSKYHGHLLIYIYAVSASLRSTAHMQQSLLCAKGEAVYYLECLT